MSEAQYGCANCPTGMSFSAESCQFEEREAQTGLYIPGLQCPFVRLDKSLALNAEWEEKAKNWMASPEAAQRLDGYRELASELNAKDGEILVLKNQLLKAQREATELRGLLDEHDIDITTEID